MKLNFKSAGFWYWTIGAVLVGVIMAPMFYSANPEDFSKYRNMKHGTIEVPHSLPVPEVKLEVFHDIHSGWNLHIITKNFKFTPELVNTPDRPNEGHAHLYINGYKITRIYGHWFHLGGLSPGKYDIKVSLNGNDHRTYTYEGKPISSTVQIEQKYSKPMDMQMMMKGRGTIGWPGLPDVPMTKNGIMGATGMEMDMPGMDHGNMDHSKMPGMDHGNMDHSKMPGMDHGKKDDSSSK